MFPYLLVTEKEFLKVFTFGYSYKRYIFAVLWYSVIATGIYFHQYIIPNFGFVSYHHLNILVFLVLFIFLTRGLFTHVPNNSVSDQEMDEEFKGKIGLIIACHNSQDVLPFTLEAALKHFPAEAIYIADNNKVVPTPNLSKEICEKYGVNYIFTQVSNKTRALRNTVKYINTKYSYLISMDDDTLFPAKFYINEDVFADEKIGCVGFGIRIKNKQNLIERCVDIEYKLYGYSCFSRNFGSGDFGVGIAYMMKKDLFTKCIDVNPCDGRLPFGEDGIQGVICRQNGYVVLQDLNNFFLTYCPDKLFTCGKSAAISGYDAGTLWKQRPLRWYRSGTIRLVLELSTIFTYNAKRVSDSMMTGLLRNLYYRYWKLLEGLMIFVIISFPFILYDNFTNITISKLENFAILYILFPVMLAINMLILKYKFRNKNDLKIDYIMVLVYPLFMKIKFLMNVFGFFSCLVFFIPFETYFGFYNLKNYTFPKEIVEVKEETIEIVIDIVELDIVSDNEESNPTFDLKRIQQEIVEELAIELQECNYNIDMKVIR